MQTLNDYLEEKNYEKIINEIVELKMKHPLSEEGKLRIQKLQQQLSKYHTN